MRSTRGLLGAIFVLLAVPAAVLAQVLLGSGSAVAVHVVLAAGSLLVALAVFDFELPKWVAWIGCAGIGGLAVIFLLQGAADLTQNGALTYLAYPVLGSWPERLLPDLFIFWLVAVLLLDSRGWTRLFGFVAMAVVVAAEVYSYALISQGTTLNAEVPGARALYLLPFLWLLFESGKRRTAVAPATPAPAE